MLKKLDAGGFSLTACMSDGATSAYIAAETGQVEVLEYLKTRPGVSFEAADEMGVTPAIIAAYQGLMSNP